MSKLDFDISFEYNTKNNDNSSDKWKIYLFEIFNGILRERVDEMIENSEYKSFFLGLKYEYGYNVQKDINKAFSLYKKGGQANSTDYFSMARLYDIYKTKDKRFKITNDRNLEFIYLLKSFAYLPIFYLYSDPKKNRFPLNIKYAVLSFLTFNGYQLEKIFSYIDYLSNSGKYKDILSQNDSNLIKGFIDGYVNCSLDGDQNCLDLLVALSLEGNLEANCRLISIYFKILYNSEINDENKTELLKNEINKQFLMLEKAQYYKAYAQYGLFLYNEMRMFDKALNIFKQGYENNMFECSLYYFHAFTKSDNQSIYDLDKFNSQQFIYIFKILIDAFLYGKIFALELMFDFFYIIGKHYNLFSQLSSKYMKYLDEIAILCLSFIDEKNGEENMKKYNPNDLGKINHSAYHALSMIYMYGLTQKVKKNLLKAETCLNSASKLNEYIQPYYANLKYKIKKKLFKLKVFEDEDELNQYGNELFQLYYKYRNYKYYGNSFYYIFGKLYEKGIGTNKDEKMAYKYYQKGCSSLVNLNDSFIIVYKRYLCLKILSSDKYISLFSLSNNNPFIIIKFRLSIGTEIKLPVRNEATIGDIKDELYKKIELQNLMIETFLFQANQLDDKTKISQLKLTNEDVIVVIVEQKKRGFF